MLCSLSPHTHTQVQTNLDRGKAGIKHLPYLGGEKNEKKKQLTFFSIASSTPLQYPLGPHYLLGINVDLESNFKGFPPDIVLVFINNATLGNIVHVQHLKENTTATSFPYVYVCA